MPRDRRRRKYVERPRMYSENTEGVLKNVPRDEGGVCERE